MKLTYFLVLVISRTKNIYAQTLTVSAITFKKGNFTLGTFRKFYYQSSYLQRFLHKNEIVQNLQNYIYQGVNHGHFRKPLQGSTNIKETTTLRQPMCLSRAVESLLFTLKLL